MLNVKPMDVIVSYPRGRFFVARDEAANILKHVGDDRPRLKWSAVDGIAVVHMSLDNHLVIAGLRELTLRSETHFRYAVKWIPVGC